MGTSSSTILPNATPNPSSRSSRSQHTSSSTSNPECSDLSSDLGRSAVFESNRVHHVVFADKTRLHVVHVEGKSYQTKVHTSVCDRDMYGHCHVIDSIVSLCSGGDPCVHLYDILEGRRLARLRGRTSYWNWTSAYVPQVSILVSGTSTGLIRAFRLNLDHLEQSEFVGLLKTAEAAPGLNCVCSLQPFQKSVRVASGSFDGGVRVWDLKRRCQERQIEGHTSIVSGVGLNVDENLLMSVAHDNSLRVWNVDSGREIASVRLRSMGMAVCCLKEKEHVTVVGLGDGSIEFYDLRNVSSAFRKWHCGGSPVWNVVEIDQDRLASSTTRSSRGFAVWTHKGKKLHSGSLTACRSSICCISEASNIDHFRQCEEERLIFLAGIRDKGVEFGVVHIFCDSELVGVVGRWWFN